MGQQPEVVMGKDAQGGDLEMIVPLVSNGIKVISMGFLIGEDQPVMWRGPMLNSALKQFLGQVMWGELDYLIVDLPPGTGDVQISLIQLVKITGIVHVTTPQDVALQDVVKGVAMFQKLNVPILGVIENMSYFVCPHCGQTTEVFGSGGGDRVSERYGIPLLGRIPLDVRIREGGDEGHPIVLSAPDSALAAAFNAAAGQAAASISRAVLEHEEETKKAATAPLQWFGKLPSKN